MPKKTKKVQHKKNQYGWTPVKKNLPSKDGSYLVTIVPDGHPDDGYVCDAECSEEEGCFATDTDYSFTDCGEPEPVDNYGRVIAWMPKPKPFKE
jgi:hypothetical protein